ncbi:TDP-N-acetylfucosamine:lipid II N-acetylfucosaminyltransferase [Clostridium sp. YIM B02505]|uniref:TDP-N-acetylfucosamine:lipid II N-acetylfucosaminyltransferase n=1 Tax=Clostridium yunnanense TaxID=2800325 RepID=A0ABS1EUU5_9CLOT|nr:TDP-N-acetylfucosamine:lipid II N-acetylfucosaminyltransferase [Clostridium yunnanense]MBK1813063.1 TDP-N-acetylfucosamine:lipid II N-acetylfucosaminyltransferase [Clostridium yunnanense]
MYMHIMNNEKFTLPYIKFIKNNFDFKEHFFIIVGSQKYLKDNDFKNENVKFIKGTICDWIKNAHLIKTCKLVIIHGFFQGIPLKVFLSLNLNVLKKVNWVIWGGDLKKRKSSYKLVEYIDDYLKKFSTKRFGYISTLVENDYDIAKAAYMVRGEHKKAIYINPITLSFLDDIKNSHKNREDIINIQIGNSADASNNHIDAIDKLSKYENQNIKIYCPLSYGDVEYAKEVIEYGKSKFKEKFVAITNYMTPRQYGEFLGKIDIAIFNNDRQQALGNIFALAYLGAKIYMRDDTTMWKDLVHNEKYKFYAIKDIPSINFNSFSEVNNESIYNNKVLSKCRFDEDYIKKVWQNILLD